MGKGGDWEREIAKFLSKWLTGSEKPYQYWRMPGSGSLATIHEENIGLSGDIRALTPEADFLTNVFSIEAKIGYPDASLDKHLKYNKSDPLYSFWQQCLDDAIKSKKLPMLIYKKKGLPTPWVGIIYSTYLKLDDYLEKLRFVHLYWGGDLLCVFFFEMKEFFEAITPDIIKNNIIGYGKKDMTYEDARSYLKSLGKWKRNKQYSGYEILEFAKRLKEVENGKS